MFSKDGKLNKPAKNTHRQEAKGHDKKKVMPGHRGKSGEGKSMLKGKG
jgi:hypothetical protein